MYQGSRIYIPAKSINSDKAEIISQPNAKLREHPDIKLQQRQ